VISWSTCRYGNADINRNIRYIYVGWFEQKLDWSQFETEDKDSSDDAYLNALHEFWLEFDCSN